MNAMACSGTGTQDFRDGFVDGLVCSHGNRVCGRVIVATSQIAVMWMELVLVVSETGSTASPDNM